MPPVISGRVTGPDGPVTLARVIVEQAPGPMPDIAGLTADDGTFTVGTVGPGRYVLAVYADGFVPERAVAEIGAGDRSVDLRVHLRLEETDPA